MGEQINSLKRKKTIWGWITIIDIIVLLVMVSRVDMGYREIVDILLLVFFGILFFVFALKFLSAWAAYSDSYKENFVEDSLKQRFEVFEYRGTSGITKEEMEKIGLFREITRFNSEDYLKASYKDVTFEFSQIWLAQVLSQTTTKVTTKKIISGNLFRVANNTANSSVNVNASEIDNDLSNVTDYLVASKQLRPYTFASIDDSYYKVESEEMEFLDSFVVYAQKENFEVPVAVKEFVAKWTKDNRRIVLWVTKDYINVVMSDENNIFDQESSGDIDSAEERKSVEKEIDYICEVLEDVEIIKK